MSIVAAFGDDDHTAADGPYVRVLKVRKWLYVISTCAILLGLRLYDPEAVKSLLRVLSLPSWLLVQATIAGAVYLLIQYGLLCGQLWRTYDIILDERLTFRRAEELARASEKIDQALTARETYRTGLIDRARARHQSAQAQMSLAQRNMASAASARHEGQADWAHLPEPIRRQIEDSNASRTADAETSLVNAMSELEDALKDLQQRSGSGEWYGRDPQGLLLHEQLEKAKNDFEGLRLKDPASRPGYRSLEKAVDIQRIALPPITTSVALLSLFRLVL